MTTWQTWKLSWGFWDLAKPWDLASHRLQAGKSKVCLSQSSGTNQNQNLLCPWVWTELFISPRCHLHGHICPCVLHHSSSLWSFSTLVCSLQSALAPEGFWGRFTNPQGLNLLAEEEVKLLGLRFSRRRSENKDGCTWKHPWHPRYQDTHCHKQSASFPKGVPCLWQCLAPPIPVPGTLGTDADPSRVYWEMLPLIKTGWSCCRNKRLLWKQTLDVSRFWNHFSLLSRPQRFFLFFCAVVLLEICSPGVSWCRWAPGRYRDELLIPGRVGDPFHL